MASVHILYRILYLLLTVLLYKWHLRIETCLLNQMWLFSSFIIDFFMVLDTFVKYLLEIYAPSNKTKGQFGWEIARTMDLNWTYMAWKKDFENLLNNSQVDWIPKKSDYLHRIHNWPTCFFLCFEIDKYLDSFVATNTR